MCIREGLFPVGVFVGRVERILAPGIAREPSLAHPFLLLEDLLDAPQAGEGKYTQKSRQGDVLHVHCGGNPEQSQQQESPPDAGPEILLAFDHRRMRCADDQKSQGSDEQAVEVEAVNPCFHFSVAVFRYRSE